MLDVVLNLNWRRSDVIVLTQPTFTCEIGSKLPIKTPEKRQRRQLRRFGLFIVNFEQISHIVLVFPLLTLNK